MDQAPQTMRRPVLFMEGDEHRDQRRQTARFFTPATTDSQHRTLMEAYADEIIAGFRRRGRADLSDLSLDMAEQSGGGDRRSHQ